MDVAFDLVLHGTDVNDAQVSILVLVDVAFDQRLACQSTYRFAEFQSLF